MLPTWNMPNHLIVAIDLFIHFVVAAVLFLAIAFLGIAVDWILQQAIEFFHVSPWLAEPLRALKYLIFLVDIALLVIYLLGMVKEAWKKLCK